MDTTIHKLESLFAQLGLDDSEEGIARFVKLHKSIPDVVPLHEADFWTDSQANFIRQAVEEDADWAEIVDHLDAMLRD